MHQHPRPPPVTASPANSEQTNPTRTNNPRDRDLQALRTSSPLTQGSGSSEDFANARQDSPADNPGVQMQRLNQVIQNFHTKAALIILQSRVELSPAYSQKTETKRVNRWFNLDIDETDEYRDDIKRWKICDVEDNRPPPLVIEVFLTTDPLQQGQRLVIVDEDGKRWDVMTTLSSRNNHRRMAEANEVILERWTIQLGDATGPIPPDLATLLPLVYKKSIVFFRSLYTYSNFLPAWKLSRKIGKSRSTMAMKIGYRIVDGSQLTGLSRPDNLNLRLFDSNSDVLSSYDFGMTDSPAGPFSVKVDYRQNCDFRIDDSEELLSSRFLGADDDLFRPSLPVNRAGARTTEVGSLPTDRRQHLLESPELGLAYGSLSTFHQAGIASGTSPISALRNAQDFDTSSPPTPEPARQTLHSHTTTAAQPSRTSLRAVAANRRSSFSVQPFKTPTLSASPLGVSPLASSPRTHSARVPTLGSLTEEGIPPPAAPVTLAGRRAGSLTSDNAVASSTSSSPKPAPVTRYSSSFSHRRARLSSGGTTVRTDDDQTSSGRGSAASSAQPGSGLMTEPATGGGSSGSVAEDDGENISEFLKMIELQKDLLSSPSSAAAEASTRRTAAALNRFHRMRESNAALSDSMSSSLMLQRSSGTSSRQLSGVPPMVAGTSISTSSSPGKPISPHTPHTPFAPSRLSAAYSHDDGDTPHRLSVREEAPSPSDAPTEETAQAESSTANVPAIDIPNSPRPFLPGYPRSSSAQRQRPLNDADDDVAGFYGMRSASMGADRRRGHGHGHRREAARADDDDDDDGEEERPVESASSSRRHRPTEGSVRRASHQAVPHRHSSLATATPLGASDGAGSEEPSDLSARASVAGDGPPAGSTTTNTNTSYRARQRMVASRPHQTGGSGSGPGSSSSRRDSGGGGNTANRGSGGVGDEDGPGNSVQVGGDGHGGDAGSTGSEPTSSWGVRGSSGGGHHGHGGHHRRRTSRASVVSNLSRPVAAGLDEDDFLPFAMEKSDFNMGGKA